MLVQLVGLQAGKSAEGLIIEADDVTVRGVGEPDFDSGSGIKIEGSGNRVEDNFIGTDSLGRRDSQGNDPKDPNTGENDLQRTQHLGVLGSAGRGGFLKGTSRSGSSIGQVPAPSKGVTA